VDVQAALAAQQQAMAQQQALAQQQAMSQQAAMNQPPYGGSSYPLQTTNYGGGYDLRQEERSPMTGRLIVAAVLVVAVACAFCAGCLFGFEILSPMFPAAPTGPTPRPTPQGLNLIFQFVSNL
jgi:hypothetical protein